jgi:predicted metal-dependent hydrolase
MDPPRALTVAQRLLDEGRPFEAHEVLEGVWKSTSDEPMLWRGLAQLAVGVTHRDRGNLRGATALLSRGAETLAPFAGRRDHGVDVDGLRRWATVAAEDPQRAPVMPPLRSQAADDRS